MRERPRLFSIVSRALWIAFSVGAIGSVFWVLDCRSSEPLHDLGSVGAFRLTDQTGKPFSAEDLRGKTSVVAFMFTRCPTICPRITRQMREIQNVAAARQLPLFLLSISVDPDYDTPKVLSAYAKQYGAQESSWKFLTGDFEVIKRASVKGFKLALESKPDPAADHFGILHGSHLMLVDQRGHLRGYYATSDDEAMGKLVQDAERLVNE